MFNRTLCIMKNHKVNESQKDMKQEIRKIRIIMAILIPAVIATIGACAFIMHKNLSETVAPVDDKNDKSGLHKEDNAEKSVEKEVVSESELTDTQMEEEINVVLPETEDAGEEYIKETLFLGDSNTVRMMDYGFTSEDRTFAVPGMGIQSVKTLKCAEISEGGELLTMVEAVKALSPSRIIITFGTNNANGMTTRDFIETYVAALDAIKDASPKADILINSIPPICEKNSYESLSQKKIDRFNKALIVMAKEQGYKFIDSASVMKDENTGYAKTGYTVEDGIHISEDGFNAMFKYIRTHSYNSNK